MSQTNDAADFDCILETVIGFMLPFFLAASGGNPETAKAAVTQLIDAYNASTPTELDLVGRIIGFSTAALDNLRLSMTPGLSDTKILRYRSNAVTLSRASDQALKRLEALQAGRPQMPSIPRPSVAPAPTQATPTPIGTAAHQKPLDIEAMKRDARIMMGTFSKSGGQSSTAIPVIANTASLVDAAAKQAMAAIRRA